jgi:hypothetical protein
MSRLAAAFVRSGDLLAAEKALAEMQVIEDPTWPPRRRFHTLWMTSMLSLYRGDLAALESSARVELAAAEQEGNARAIAMAKADLAKAALLTGDATEAIACGRQAVKSARISGGMNDLTSALTDLCTAQLMAEDLRSAASTAREALPLMMDNDYSGFLFDALSLLAVRSGQPDVAAMLGGCADAWYVNLQMIRSPIEVRTSRMAEKEIDEQLRTRSHELRLKGSALPLANAEALAQRLLSRLEVK